MGSYKINNRYIMAALVIIFLYLSPLYILGQDAHVSILDNLDGAVATLKVLAHSGQVFGSLHAIIPTVMNGLSRNCFGTEFNLQVFLYWALPAFTAYVANLTLMRLIAFLGMLLLLKRHILPNEEHEPLAVGVALAFALLPFWPYGGLSVAGQPLALYALLNIRGHQDKKWDWLILALVPFYSSLVYSFAFFLLAMGVWWLVESIATRRLNARFLLAIIFMGLMYMLVEYRLIYTTFIDSGFVSIRSEFPISRIFGLRAAVKESLVNFLTGQYHAASLQQLVILPAAGLALVLAAIKRKMPGALAGLLFLAGIISLWFGFWFSDYWAPLKLQFGLLQEFNFSRFNWLHPLLWYLILALALKIIWDYRRWGQVLALLLIVVQIGFLFANNDEIMQRENGSPSYREFYAEDMFRNIKDYIGLPQQDYQVVSIGIHPSISQYNGFYTLDGYMSDYPLSYKHEFRQIMAAELDKSPFYRDYFDHLGGSRCYLFVQKLMYNSMMDKNTTIVIEQLDLNTAQLKRLGGKYIFSALQILNAPAIGLKLDRVFTDPHSAWKIYLYEVK